MALVRNETDSLPTILPCERSVAGVVQVNRCIQRQEGNREGLANLATETTDQLVYFLLMVLRRVAQSGDLVLLAEFSSGTLELINIKKLPS